MPETVLLMGLPNVGKSVIFNRLTGLNVRAANYCGTTVEYAAGNMLLDGQEITLIDVPGTYSLHATNEAETVAVEMLQGGTENPRMAAGGGHCDACPCPAQIMDKPTAVICVVDAGNLESSLYLLLQVLEKGLPTMAVLNRSDLAKEKGYHIDMQALSQELGTPVTPTVAITGEGIEELKRTLTALISQPEANSTNSTNSTHAINSCGLSEAPWARVEDICQRVCRKEEPSVRSRREQWGELLTRPWPGLPASLLIISLIFLVVVGLGLGLRQYLLLPFFRTLIFPQIEWAVTQIIPGGIIQNIFIGEYGFLIKGIEWPFALVLPYVISFYIALSFLEDSGYLPRLGILLDGLLNRLGLQGPGIIPLLLGYGCAIPAILATRALNSHKERLIITIMVSLAVPCIAQTGSFIALLSARSIPVMIAIFLLSFLAMIGVALWLNRLLKGDPPETLLEIPDLLLPRGEVLLKKVWLRFKHFLTDGALPMVIGVGVAALLYETGLMTRLGELMSPLVVNWLGLPSDAAVPLILGVLRRELTVLPLLDMELSTLQLFVGATVGLFYVPCIAVIAVLVREYGMKTALGILLLTTLGAFLLGGILFRMGSLLT